jgi:hypothetical protein
VAESNNNNNDNNSNSSNNNNNNKINSNSNSNNNSNNNNNNNQAPTATAATTTTTTTTATTPATNIETPARKETWEEQSQQPQQHQASSTLRHAQVYNKSRTTSTHQTPKAPITILRITTRRQAVRAHNSNRAAGMESGRAAARAYNAAFLQQWLEPV